VAATSAWACGDESSDADRSGASGGGSASQTTAARASAGAGGERGERGDGGAADGSGGSGGYDPDPEITAEVRAALATLHHDAGPPPEDPSNAVADSPLARAFGQRLFFEKALSGRLLGPDNDGSASTLGHAGEPGKVSCDGCHVPSAQFVDVRSPHQQISLAAQWTRRRSPTLLEAGFAPLYNWDGRRDTLWNQAVGVFENPAEYNSSRLFVAQQIFALHRAEYESVFGPMPALDDAVAFPHVDPLDAGCEEGPVETAQCHGKPGDGAEFDAMLEENQHAATQVAVNAAKAIAAYVRQLRCGPGRFDRWLDGDEEALSRSEQRGAALFVGRGDCATCHAGPRLTDDAFHNVGLRPTTVAVAFTDTGDRGAGEGIAAAQGDPLGSAGIYSDGDRGTLPTEVVPAMEGAFRTPTLRCVANQPSFMHTAQFPTLRHVVSFFARGGDPAGYPGTNELSPLGLSDDEMNDLVAFLGALEGDGPAADLLGPPD
jgi:cytochrome c peroxidase